MPDECHSGHQSSFDRLARKQSTNKRIEREREKARTIRRRNKAPPTHDLALMWPERMRMDCRGGGNVGYVAAVQRVRV
jgi:hypothetical protein